MQCCYCEVRAGFIQEHAKESLLHDDGRGGKYQTSTYMVVVLVFHQ